MIGVMFKYGSNITTEEGHPYMVVQMAGEGITKIRGIKKNGFRPEIAFIFETEHDKTQKSDDLMEWLHKGISYSLHPTNGQIIYQNSKVRDLFTLV